MRLSLDGKSQSLLEENSCLIIIGSCDLGLAECASRLAYLGVGNFAKETCRGDFNIDGLCLEELVRFLLLEVG